MQSIRYSQWNHVYILEPNLKVDNKTALHYAAENGYVDVVELLISKGADVGCKDKVISCVVHDIIIVFMIKQNNATALHLAGKEGHEAIVKLLVEKYHLNADVVDEVSY